MTGKRKSKLRAFTLVELVIVMSTGSMVMMLAIGSVHQAMSLSSASRREADHHRTTVRLASDFRQDVHRAAKCEVQDQSLTLTLPDETRVKYAAEGNRVTRLTMKSDETTHQEVFEFLKSSHATMERIDRPERMVLVVYRNESKIDRRIVAVLGRRLRHQSGVVAP